MNILCGEMQPGEMQFSPVYNIIYINFYYFFKNNF